MSLEKVVIKTHLFIEHKGGDDNGFDSSIKFIEKLTEKSCSTKDTSFSVKEDQATSFFCFPVLLHHGNVVAVGKNEISAMIQSGNIERLIKKGDDESRQAPSAFSFFPCR
jgi:hypothetical protein